MFRALTALGALALVATAASAQPGNLPLSPGVVPAAPFGPGMPMGRTTVSPVLQPNLVYGSLIPNRFFGSPPFPLLGGVVAYPYVPIGAPLVITVVDPTPGIGYASPFAPPAIAQKPQRPEPVLANEFPATLVVQYPAAAEVWLDGKKLDGAAAEERVLTSPVLKPGEQYTFEAKGRWTSGGKTYESKQTVKVATGNRSRLLVVSGDEVK